MKDGPYSVVLNSNLLVKNIILLAGNVDSVHGQYDFHSLYELDGCYNILRLSNSITYFDFLIRD